MERHVNEGRSRALDGLRGLAIIGVLIGHYSALLPAGFGPALFRSVLSFGWIGVDLFFALSGFLITRILLRTKGAPGFLRAFWAHRALRIFPPYFLTLLVVLSVGERVAALRPLLPPAQDRLLYFAFLGNLVTLPHDWDINMLGHLWSLAIEEQFYVLWPFCVLLLSPKGLRALAAGIVLLACSLRVHYVAAFGPSDVISYVTITRADSLAIGALAAMLLQREPSAAHIRRAGLIAAMGLIAFGCGVAACWTQTLAFVQIAGYTLLDVAFAALVFFAATAPARNLLVRALGAPRLTVFGRYSYSMYLYHVPLLWSFRALIVARIAPLWHSNGLVDALGLGALATVTFYLAKLSYEFFEKPILGLKRYFSLDTPPVGPAALPYGLGAPMEAKQS